MRRKEAGKEVSFDIRKAKRAVRIKFSGKWEPEGIHAEDLKRLKKGVSAKERPRLCTIREVDGNDGGIWK